MKTYQKTKAFLLRLRPDQREKLEIISMIEKESQAATLRKFIDNYKIPKGFKKDGK